MVEKFTRKEFLFLFLTYNLNRESCSFGCFPSFHFDCLLLVFPIMFARQDTLAVFNRYFSILLMLANEIRDLKTPIHICYKNRRTKVNRQKLCKISMLY